MRKLLSLLGAAAIAFTCGAWSLFGKKEIKLEQDTVTVETPRLKLTFKGGVITNLIDLKADYVFASMPEGAALDARQTRQTLLPGKDVKPVLTKNSETSATVTYAPEKGATLIYEFTIDGDDILIRQRVKRYDMMPDYNQKSLEIPIPFMKPEAVITGIGSKTLRNDEKRSESLLWPGSGFFFPRVVVAEGKKSVVIFFCENYFPYHNIRFIHTPENDSIYLMSAVNDLMKRTGRPLQFEKGTLDGFNWRISAQKNWVEAARAWRTHFERYSGAVPLWKNPAPIARNTHAFFTGAANESWQEDQDKYYKTIAAKYDPNNIVLFYWNGDNIVVLGDPRYINHQFPAKKAIAALKKNGFRWMGFHGYALLWGNDERIAGRLKSLTARKELPKDYVFTPAWKGGKPEEFLPTMAKWGYGDKGRMWTLLQPAAKDVQDYICYAIPDMAKMHQADGFYLDVTAEVQYGTRKNLLVIDGKTYYDGDVETFGRLRKEHPEIALMTEYAGEWVLPYAFWHWEGHFEFDHKAVRINHPLRSALYGSYSWARETTNNTDPVKNVLWNTLPEIVWGPGEKHLEDNLTDIWYNERAKMFVDNKLFFDLPKDWKDGVLAYYRNDGTGNEWFTFEETPYGYAYMKDGKALLGIYCNTAKGIPGFSIPYWGAYDAKGIAIGLNPASSYRFVKAEAMTDMEKLPLNISSVTDSVYCKEFRSSSRVTSVLFESASVKEADVAFTFTKAPLRVYVNGVQQEAGKTSFKIALPGSVDVVWNDQKIGEPEFGKYNFKDPNFLYFFRQKFFGGLNDVNGLRASVGYRGWASNWSGGCEFVTIDKVKKFSFIMAPARFNTYRSCFVTIPKETPFLTFDMARREKDKDLNMAACIRVNGVPVWTEDIPHLPAWTVRSIDLSKYAGQKVILTFEYAHKDPKRSDVTARKNNKLVLGDIRFTDKKVEAPAPVPTPATEEKKQK